MGDDIARVLQEFDAYREPRDGFIDNPFRLACSFGRPATWTEIATAWPDIELPGEIIDLWSICGEARLFEDVDYGQWGLRLLSPADAAQRTAAAQAGRAKNFHLGDIVIGEFLGDQELLVLASSEAHAGEVLVALPLDDRPDWYLAASNLAQFLARYLKAFGNKYWEDVGH